jgi:hypothetical protein
MKPYVRAFVAFASVLVFAVPAHSQDKVCAQATVIGINCGGENCSQSITLVRPYFGGNQTCLEPYFVYCCSTEYLDYTSSGFYCSGECDDAVKAILKDPVASEFSWTHTLRAKDCSAHFRPFFRSWDASEKPIDLRRRLTLSGIGG